ncbi:MAG: type VI secretion system protein ImpK [Halieaceae bacterium]|jgi:type VI secretion system protein ImpK
MDDNTPGRDPNATMLIPNPGRRLRKEAGAPSAPLAPSAPSAPGSERIPQGLQATLGSQENRLLAAANKLITVYGALSNTLSHPNVAQLQQELASEISDFDHNLKQSGVRNEEGLTARYVLCSALDEAILDTPWGAESGWGERSLLRVYHNETSGGERFFDLLDQMLARPSEYRELIELLYVLLNLGFRGKYQLDPSGDARLETLRERVYQDAYGGRTSPRSLSTKDHLSEAASPSLRGQVPLWAVCSVVLALTLMTYAGLRTWMYNGTVGLVDRLDTIQTDVSES